MRSWNVPKLDYHGRAPQILTTSEDARVIAMALAAGERLSEHEVHERAHVLVVDGDIAMTCAEGRTVEGTAGTLIELAPSERHELVARTDCHLLLVLTPWGGPGHPGTMTLAEKADVRQRAARAG